MNVEIPARLPALFLTGMRRLGRRLGRTRDAMDGSVASRAYLTQDQFQEELAVLGLSDQTFGPEDYARALGEHLRLTVSLDVVPDASHPLVARELARRGVTGEILYRADLARVQVIVPGSLPPLALVFTLLHELGHLAAGDLFVEPDDSRAWSECSSRLPTLGTPGKSGLAQNPPLARTEHREHEADLRAGYAFVAGCLGSDNPYTQRMYDIL